MKKHNILKTVLIVIGVFTILTWLIPATIIGETGDTTIERIRVGLFDVLNYPSVAIAYFGFLPLFIAVVGGFYGVLGKIGAYNKMITQMGNSFAKRKTLSIVMIIVLVSILNSIAGLQYAFLLFVPFLISVIIKMGLSKITAVIAVLGSMFVGLAGSTLAGANMLPITSALSLEIFGLAVLNLAILVVGIGLVVFNVLMLIKKETADKTSSVIVADEVKEEVKKVEKPKTSTKPKSTTKPKTTSSVKAKTTKGKKPTIKSAAKASDVIVVNEKGNCVPLVVIFSLLFLVMMTAFISWFDTFNITFFDTLLTQMNEIEIFGFTIIASILGFVSSFGTWNLSHLTILVILTIALLGLVYKLKFNDLIDGFIEGAKKALPGVVISILIYVVLVIVSYHPVMTTIYTWILDLASGFNLMTASLVSLFASVSNVDANYVFASALTLMTTEVANPDFHIVIGFLFQAIYGIVMLIAPTSIVLMVVLAVYNIPYSKWVKTIGLLFVELLVAVIAIAAIIFLTI